MVAELVPSTIPCRQPCRAASVSNSLTMQARPTSTIPSTMTKNIGATTANSTAAVAFRAAARPVALNMVTALAPGGGPVGDTRGMTERDRHDPDQFVGEGLFSPQLNCSRHPAGGGWGAGVVRVLRRYHTNCRRSNEHV